MNKLKNMRKSIFYPSISLKFNLIFFKVLKSVEVIIFIKEKESKNKF
jgi:hypothetical protein